MIYKSNALKPILVNKKPQVDKVSLYFVLYICINSINNNNNYTNDNNNNRMLINLMSHLIIY